MFQHLINYSYFVFLFIVTIHYQLHQIVNLFTTKWVQCNMNECIMYHGFKFHDFFSHHYYIYLHSIPNYKIVHQQSLVCIPARDQWFVSLPIERRTLIDQNNIFFVLVGLEVCFESRHFVRIATRKTSKRETSFSSPWHQRSVWDNSNWIIIFEKLRNQNKGFINFNVGTM